MSIKINNLRGTKDIFDQDLQKFDLIKGTAHKIAKYYSFYKLETPIIESTELFTRNLGETSDVVSKEIYCFTDKGQNNIALRPEFTAPVVRAFVSNLQHLPMPLKLFSVGPLFRYDRPQKGRMRQFNQINYELIGINGNQYEVEVMLLAVTLLKKLGIEYKLEVNSLGCEKTKERFQSELKNYLSYNKNKLSAESINRLDKNPMRVLDSKDDRDREVAKNAPKICKFYTEEAKSSFDFICKSLKELQVDFVINQNLVRGLDYYSGLIFEFKTDKLGAQDTIAAGGRYDNLVQNLGGKSTSAVGFAAGIERIAELISFETKTENKKISVVAIGNKAEKKCQKLAFDLRKSGFFVEINYNLSLKSQMKRAEKSKIAIIVGQDEIENDRCIIKNMQDGKQDSAALQSIINILQTKYGL